MFRKHLQLLKDKLVELDLAEEFHEAVKLSNLTQLGAIARKLAESEATVPAGEYLEERLAAFDLVALRAIDEELGGRSASG